MLRNRLVKPAYFLDPVLFSAERYYALPLRIAFLGLMAFCDRDGYFSWDPNLLQSYILPYDNIDFLDVLDALRESGFITKYWHANTAYGYVIGWEHYQSKDEQEPSHGFPPLENSYRQRPIRFVAPSNRIVVLSNHCEAERILR